MQFFAHQSHPYIENRFINEQLPIHLADVKTTLLSNLNCFQHA